jgi:hypothetical protein
MSRLPLSCIPTTVSPLNEQFCYNIQRNSYLKPAKQQHALILEPLKKLNRLHLKSKTTFEISAIL